MRGRTGGSRPIIECAKHRVEREMTRKSRPSVLFELLLRLFFSSLAELYTYMVLWQVAYVLVTVTLAAVELENLCKIRVTDTKAGHLTKASISALIYNLVKHDYRT